MTNLIKLSSGKFLVELANGKFLDISRVLLIDCRAEYVYTRSANTNSIAEEYSHPNANNILLSLSSMSNWHKFGTLWLNFDHLKDIYKCPNKMLPWAFYLKTIDNYAFLYNNIVIEIEDVKKALETYNNNKLEFQELEPSKLDFEKFLDIEI